MRFAIKTRPERRAREELPGIRLAAGEIPPFESACNGPKRTLRTAARWATERNATIQDPAKSVA